ncbi:MAG: hypothetical protein J6X68_01110 [Lachnospiraceae bacterium]|nr:hypothetical protein [Lachnospiraceae bacterium]
MNVYLLYKDREWAGIKKYYDAKSIVQDLGLKTLYTNAGKDVVFENGSVKNIKDQDAFIYDTMSKVMVAPLISKEEIVYRQEIIKDCLANEDFIKQLYTEAGRIISEWDKLGRKSGYTGRQDLAAWAEKQIHITELFAGGLKEIKGLLKKYHSFFESEGLKDLAKRICIEFDDEYEKNIEKLIKDVAFYTKGNEDKDGNVYTYMPKIKFRGKLKAGLKLEDIVLEDVDSESIRYRNPKSTIAKIVEFKNSLTPNSFSSKLTPAIEKQVEALEQNIVNYAMSFTRSFIEKFSNFFEQLLLQTAFYRGAVNLRHHMKRSGIEYCFPTVCDNKNLSFIELKEFVMCMEQRVNAVGNTCSILNKQLVIITGANQGGKSTFLRSVGIAQVMMQAGLPVAAEDFSSGIFPSLFTHFTRREDSAMNSGRLDEELGRMNSIIENLDDRSLVLLNESFATTTEVDGSIIAYDIIKALNEAGVKILTVTHLLSFAKKMYSESEERTKKGEDSGITFFCAERKPDGQRTFKMIQSVPELTSFGLDLYKQVIGTPKLYDGSED